MSVITTTTRQPCPASGPTLSVPFTRATRSRMPINPKPGAQSSSVTPAVWIRGSIVATSALLTVVFTAQMARGSKSGYLRLRIVSAIMLVAVVAIIALPGVFPLWLKLEQGICGLLLLGVVVIVNGKRLRLAFAKR